MRYECSPVLKFFSCPVIRAKSGKGWARDVRVQDWPSREHPGSRLIRLYNCLITRIQFSSISIKKLDITKKILCTKKERTKWELRCCFKRLLCCQIGDNGRLRVPLSCHSCRDLQWNKSLKNVQRKSYKVQPSTLKIRLKIVQPNRQTLVISIQRVSTRETDCVIRWIEIFPVDSVIHLLNNNKLATITYMYIATAQCVQQYL